MFILKFIEWLGREKTESASLMNEDVAFGMVMAVIVALVFIADKVV